MIFEIIILSFSDETAKWEKITYLGILTCTGLGFYNLSKGHPHFEEPPVSLFSLCLILFNFFFCKFPFTFQR